MKLVSFQVSTPFGERTRIGAVDEAWRFVDLAASYGAALRAQGMTAEAADRVSAALLPSDMVAFIEEAGPAMAAAREAVTWAGAQLTDEVDCIRIRWDPAEVTLLAPVPRPAFLRDFMAFETHLKNIYPRLGREIPEEWYRLPVYYKGNPRSIGAHGEDIAIPTYADALDYEFELGLVIGKGGVNIPKESALDHLFGLMIYNDFSAREIQSREMTVGLGPAKGKDFLRGHVFGPYLVTVDELPDLDRLRMVCRVNGEIRCDESSGTMHWKIADLIAHASLDEIVAPGEVFGTGTVGNGSGAEIGQSLMRGDVVELEVTGLGTLRNRVV